MPELPEVETVKRALGGHLIGKVIDDMEVMRTDLREPISDGIVAKVSGNKVTSLKRKAKYILVGFDDGTMIVHLGMSGTVRAEPLGSELRKHDHVQWWTKDCVLRYNDPRRFGRVLWCDDPLTHPLLTNTGMEPLGKSFTTKALMDICADRRMPIKQVLMDGKKIAGIGNIYASEALFSAKVLPKRAARSITKQEASAIVRSVRSVLRKAIDAGGSTLRDHAQVDGKPGYFQFSHNVYDRSRKPCKKCSTPIRRIVIGKRATYFCPKCQN